MTGRDKFHRRGGKGLSERERKSEREREKERRTGTGKARSARDIPPLRVAQTWATPLRHGQGRQRYPSPPCVCAPQPAVGETPSCTSPSNRGKARATTSDREHCTAKAREQSRAGRHAVVAVLTRWRSGLGACLGGAPGRVMPHRGVAGSSRRGRHSMYQPEKHS